LLTFEIILMNFPEHYRRPELEELLGKVFEGASFSLNKKTKADCLAIVEKYNKHTAMLALNALSALGWARDRGQQEFQETLQTLKSYDFPQPSDLKKETKYMHPGLRARLGRAQGMSREDINFFQTLYDKLGVVPHEG